MPGQGLCLGVRAGEPRPPEADTEWLRRGLRSCSPPLSAVLSVQAYIRMFLLRELASPVGNATGIRDEKDT